MLTIREVLNSIEREIQFPVESLQVSINPATVNNEDLLDKIQRRLETKKKFYPKIDFDSFRLIGGYEIGNYTGNRLLRFMISLLCDERIRQNGNCVVFNVDQHAAFAIPIFLKDKTLELTTPPVDDKKFNHLFTNLFNDNLLVEKIQRDPREVSQLRLSLPDKLKQFLHQPLSNNIACPYSLAFLGCFLDICRAYFYVHPSNTENKKLIKALLPSCLKLAVDCQQSGKLQPLLHYTKTEAAKEIIRRAIRHNSDGLFVAEDIQEVIKELKLFYEIA